eukprot:3121343-Amphidinium_carterae.4
MVARAGSASACAKGFTMATPSDTGTLCTVLIGPVRGAMSLVRDASSACKSAMFFAYSSSVIGCNNCKVGKAHSRRLFKCSIKCRRVDSWLWQTTHVVPRMRNANGGKTRCVLLLCVDKPLYCLNARPHRSHLNGSSSSGSSPPGGKCGMSMRSNSMSGGCGRTTSSVCGSSRPSVNVSCNVK